MLRLVFASHNKFKTKEVSHVILNHLMAKGLDKKLEILDLEAIGCYEAIPETGDTLAGNATLKSSYIFRHYGYDCFADDTGLEADALNGLPGVHSARYAGDDQDFERNIQKLLRELKDKNNRQACFRTVISLIISGEEHLFEGVVNGMIMHEKRGTSGFGYDPVFLPDGNDRTFAEMTLAEKNRISHRAMALRKMIAFLEDYLSTD
jgi:XTP/dITP diphosphohydrolase